MNEYQSNLATVQSKQNLLLEMVLQDFCMLLWCFSGYYMEKQLKHFKTKNWDFKRAVGSFMHALSFTNILMKQESKIIMHQIILVSKVK